MGTPGIAGFQAASPGGEKIREIQIGCKYVFCNYNLEDILKFSIKEMRYG
jgi:hypothetical protein